MAKKSMDLKPDIVLKNYWRKNEQFADLFNAVLFHGETLLKPEELADIDTEESSVLEHKEYAESLKASRDNIKICKRSKMYGVVFVILGLEHQEHVHYAMPMRVMGYDYGAYKKQYENNAKKYGSSKGMETDEYLSKMKKTDMFVPVITMVVYYGEKPWDGAVSLHEMLNIPEEIKPYVNNYKLLLVEARQNNLILHNMNNVNLFNLLEILLDANRTLAEKKENAIEYTNKHKVDKSVIMTVAGATNCKIDYNLFYQKGDVDMCTVWEETRAEGISEGISKGISKGIQALIESCQELGIPYQKSQNQVMLKFSIPADDAKKYMDKYWK